MTSAMLMKTEVLEYVEKSLCNDLVQQVYGETVSSLLPDLLTCLSSPPLFTTVRLNTRIVDANSAIQQLQQLLTQQYAVMSRQCPAIFLHPLLKDCCIVVNCGPFTDVCPDEASSEVIVDVWCGAAVLRGADIYVQGILAASAGMLKGDLVSVYVDVDEKCRKGLTKHFAGSKMFIGNGVAQISRHDAFAAGGKVRTGVGIQMTRPIYVAPSLSRVIPHVIFPQNLPSIVCSHVLGPRPGEAILDMCAAPGGKTTHLATLMNNTGRVVALDKSKNKLSKLEDCVRRWQLDCVEVYGYDSTQALDPSASSEGAPPYPVGTFDRILLDAPCSGLGQRPVIRNSASLSEITSYQPLQRKLLTTAVALLKPGGCLVYSTCTIPVEENECIVAWALTTFPCLQLVQQEPHVGGCGWPCSSLTAHQRALVQRFIPGVSTDVTTSRPAYDTDTIGFFIAQFCKT